MNTELVHYSDRHFTILNITVLMNSNSDKKHLTIPVVQTILQLTETSFKPGLFRYSKFYPKKSYPNWRVKVIHTNKLGKKYYPEVLSKFFLSKMYVTYSTSLYMNNFPMLHVTNAT